MKKFIPFLILLFSYGTQAQNLVPNYSFEIDTACPNYFGQIYYATPWFQPSIYWGNIINSSSSDYYNQCAPTGWFSVPENIYGGHQSSRSGIAYVGIEVDNNTDNTREYIETFLLDTLTRDKEYCVEFYLSLGEFSMRSISNFGAYFSKDSLISSTYEAIENVTPQIENSIGTYLTDTTNWMRVSGTFIATGGEKFITIGNFHSPNNTNTLNTGFGNTLGAYYFIDDVSVVDCSVGVDEVKEKLRFDVYPNPAKNEIIIKSNELRIKKIKINNVLGGCVYEHDMENEKKEISVDVSGLVNGMYFVEVVCENKIYNAKFIKQ